MSSGYRQQTYHFQHMTYIKYIMWTLLLKLQAMYENPFRFYFDVVAALSAGCYDWDKPERRPGLLLWLVLDPARGRRQCIKYVKGLQPTSCVALVMGERKSNKTFCCSWSTLIIMVTNNISPLVLAWVDLCSLQVYVGLLQFCYMIAVVRKIQEFEAPYITLKQLEGTYRVAVRKT